MQSDARKKYFDIDIELVRNHLEKFETLLKIQRVPRAPCKSKMTSIVSLCFLMYKEYTRLKQGFQSMFLY